MNSLEPVPPDSPIAQELRQARWVAVDAEVTAEDLETQARAARRRATAARKHYEILLSGTAMTLPFEETT